MDNKKFLASLGVILGLIFCVIGYVYASRGAGMLPHFFPGFAAGVAAKHIKHSIAAFVLAAACFVYAWFVSAPKKAI
jgi:hypothetical protein